MSSNESVLPTETLQLDSGLSLTPRFHLILTIHRADTSTKPLDEWQFKTSLTHFIKSTFSITIPEDDLRVRKFKDIKKRKRTDPIARGNLFIRDFGFLNLGKIDRKDVENKFSEWKKMVVEKMDGIELSLAGVKFKLNVEVSKSDDFERMRKEWDEDSAFEGYSRSRKREPDTIVLRNVPSRWFAETRVSSKPSMLVTHTIFSALGKIRNLDVAEDDGIGKDADEDDEDVVPALHCKIVVRFENHKEFAKALKMLCGRSLQKQGSRLIADYDVTWDKEGIFRNARSQSDENNRSMPKVSTDSYRSDAARYQSHVSRYSENSIRSKRFKE